VAHHRGASSFQTMSNPRSMHFISSATFWGLIIVLFGLSIILREIFHVNFPFGRVIFGCLLLYWGFKMIAGGFNRGSHSSNVFFAESRVDGDGDRGEYNIIFGSGTIDLFKMATPEQNRTVEVNVVFGDGRLVVNDSIPIRVDISSAFGSVHSPDRSTSGLGNSSYRTSAYRDNAPFVRIKASAVFGKLNIENKRW